ncbi:MAG TPA: RNA methyltransferase [Desulfitobacteriaceae bacterium]|nr:RNA methyltransferase [Desulfitobacteriaceae bacterium]
MLVSLQNEQVKQVVNLRRRKGREEARQFVVEGRRFLEEALNREAGILRIFICPQREQPEWQPLLKESADRQIPIIEIDERVLYKISSTVEPQGILAVVRQPVFTWKDLTVDSRTVLLIIDGVQNPGNLGTILRTALAAGVCQVCLTKGTVDLYNDKVLRSTMGAIFSLTVLADLAPEEIIDYCRSRGLKLIIADLEGEVIYKSGMLKLPLALVVGNEANGPSPLFSAWARQHLKIPMNYNVESLNAAMAAGILLYEIVRQRDFC